MLMSIEKIVRIYNAHLKKITNIRPMKRIDVIMYFRSIKPHKMSYCCGSTILEKKIKKKKDPRHKEDICFKCRKRVYKCIVLKEEEYCHRCGRRIGENYDCKKHKIWKKFILCDYCYEDKNSGKSETTPDLEDMKRFNVVI